MSSPPKVFISYSHDSLIHKQWVARVATRLRGSGIDAVLDQWDLNLGDDVTRFMEHGVQGSDRVLVVCTNEYVRKAEAGEGGVGYERLIVTAELVANLGTNKFIPILRNVSSEHKVPIFLATRLYIDFSNDDEFDTKFEELLRELHKAPALEKPPLGKNPFAVTRSGEQADHVSQDQPVQLPIDREDPKKIYALAVELARRNDLYGWRQLVKQVRKPIRQALLQWRRKHEQSPPKSIEAKHAAMDEAVDEIAGLLVLAMVGVESGRDGLRDQRGLFDQLLDIEGWAGNGPTIIVELPYSLAYVYQALHGAICAYSGQLELALELADMPILNKYEGTYNPMWEVSSIAFPESLGGVEPAWKFLSSAIGRWAWLQEIFGVETDYRTSLTAYFTALSLAELASDISEGRAAQFKPNAELFLNIPPVFALEEVAIQRRAVKLLVRGDGVDLIWRRKAVEKKDVIAIWDVFSTAVKRSIRIRSSRFVLHLPIDDLFK